jgi:sulfur-oxidizing protein SoxB
MGRQPAARRSDHLRGHRQRDCDHLSELLPDGDDRRLLKEIFEDIADNIFNPDPYYQQGGDMVRAGGLGYTIDVHAPVGSRISSMTLLKTGQPIDPSRKYVVSGWASINQGTEGPPIWEVVERYVARAKTVKIDENSAVKIVGA